MKRIILLLLLLIWTAFILFLSFQSGTDTANTSMRLTKYILGLFTEVDIPYETLEYWHLTFRFLAHPVIFCLFSALAMGVTTEFAKKRWVCVVFTGLSGIVLSVVTEVGKWNIPGRHVDVREMLWNVVGVMVGIVVYMVVANMEKLIMKLSK